MVNLRAMFYDALFRGLTSPEQLVADVKPKLSAQDRDEVLDRLLRLEAREAIRAGRSSSGPIDPEESLEIEPEPAPEPGVHNKPKRYGRNTKSSATHHIRDWWREKIKQDSVFVGHHSEGNVNGWKKLAYCTQDDVRFLIAEHQEDARESIAKAKKLEPILTAMIERNAEVVNDLPDEPIKEFLS